MRRSILLILVAVPLAGCPAGGGNTVDILVVCMLLPSDLAELSAIRLVDNPDNTTEEVILDIGEVQALRTHVFKDIPLDRFGDRIFIYIEFGAGPTFGSYGFGFDVSEIAGAPLPIVLWRQEDTGNLRGRAVQLDDASASASKELPGPSL